MRLQKLFSTILAAIIGGIVMGLITFFALVHVGANYGCAQSIDALFGMQGYESCGAFGVLVGLAVGMIIGIFIEQKVNGSR